MHNGKQTISVDHCLHLGFTKFHQRASPVSVFLPTGTFRAGDGLDLQRVLAFQQAVQSSHYT